MDPTEQTPAAEPEQTAAVTNEDTGSLDDHEAQFGDAAKAAAKAPHVEEGDEPAGQRARDDKGQFVKAPAEKPKERHRARSAQAGAEDVPRIAELTRRLRDAERERDEWKGKASTSRTTDTSSPPAVPALPASARPAAAAPAKPDYNDEKKYPYGTADPQYQEDLADWKVTTALAKRDADHAERAAKADRDREAERINASWSERVTTARERYKDFDEIALTPQTAWTVGSAVDAFIWEDENGADVLYHLQTHPEDTQEILAAPILRQVKLLSLLSQRFDDSDRTQAAKTGSAAAPRKPSSPRPPNPVRTGPIRSSSEPPGDDASLDEHEAFYGERARR